MTARKVDANQAEIIEALRKAGATVHPTHTVGKGFPDVVVGLAGNNFLLEIKTHGGRMTKDEIAWHEAWRGQVAVVFNVAQALEAIGVLEKL